MTKSLAVKYERSVVGKYICSTKRRWKKLSDAWESSLFAYKTFGTLNQVYTCPYCTGYHLTSKRVEIGQMPESWKEGLNKWFGWEVLPLQIKSVKSDFIYQPINEALARLVEK